MVQVTQKNSVSFHHYKDIKLSVSYPPTLPAFVQVSSRALIITVVTRMAAAPTFRVIEPYQPEMESFMAYSEQVLLFFEANNIEEGHRVPVLLSAL